MTKYTYFLFSLLSANLLCSETHLPGRNIYNIREETGTLPEKENNIARRAKELCAKSSQKNKINFMPFFPEEDIDMTPEGTLSKCTDLEENFSSIMEEKFSSIDTSTANHKISRAAKAICSSFFKMRDTGKVSLVKSVNGLQESFFFQFTQPNGTIVYSDTFGILLHTSRNAKAFLFLCALSTNPNGNMDTVNKLVPLLLKK